MSVEIQNRLRFFFSACFLSQTERNAKKRSKGYATIFTLNLEFKHNPIKHVEPIDSKNDDLLQVCDLLLGVVNNELTQNTNPFKKKLRNLALKRLRKETFTREFEDEKFTIWHWKPEK